MREQTMNQYEGMFIFPETIREEGLEEVVGHAKAEIEKLGGAVLSTIRLGKRTFARCLRKQGSGHYVVIGFQLGADRVSALQERFKLAGETFRVQINRASESPKAESKDGVAQ